MGLRFIDRLRGKSSGQPPDQKTPRGLTDWANVVMTAATLIVGVVGLWNTLRISGLEDYFQSEISRRNSDLNRLMDREDILERRSEERADRIEELDLYAEGLSTTALAQSAAIDQGQLRLDQVNSLAARANEELTASRSELVALRARAVNEERNLDLRFRQQVMQDFAISIILRQSDSWYSLDLPRITEFRSEVGKSILGTIQGHFNSSDVPEVRALTNMVKSEFSTYCPALEQRVIVVSGQPAIRSIPMNLPDVRSFRTQATYDAAFVRAAAEYRRLSGELYGRHQAAREEYMAAQKQIENEAQGCVCATLVTNGISRSEICPTSD